MSDNKEGTTQINEPLLSEEEQSTCQKVTLSGQGLMNQRVKALLALNKGSTRAEACEQTGLTLGQVRYLLATFRQKRLGMFAEEVWMEMEEQPQTEEILKTVVEEEGETKVDKVPVTKEGKKKKQKKEKKVKMKKSDKKDKKPKKKDMAKAKGIKGKGKKGKAKGNRKVKR